MNVTLHYTLPEERGDAMLALHAVDLSLVIWDISQSIRTWTKHGHKFKDADEALDAVRDSLISSMDSHGITEDMMT